MVGSTDHRRLELDIQRLLPAAIHWVEAQEGVAQGIGVPLNSAGQDIARRVGVAFPERIRLVLADDLPMPTDPPLLNAAIDSGLLNPMTGGLTLGYGIFIKARSYTDRLLAHECRHVFQMERAGSLDAFLAQYLAQLATYGYRDAPFEVDARGSETLAQSES